jgi:hypothetical protein
MVDRLKSIEAKGSDSRWNTRQGKWGIQAKMLLEDYGIASPTTFTTFGDEGVSADDRALMQDKMDELTQAGFGKKKGRQKVDGQNFARQRWQRHLAKCRKKNPGLTYKQCQKLASSTYTR